MHLFSRLSTPEIGVDELDALIQSGTVRVLDVREDWEFSRGRVPGAVNVPLKKLPVRAAATQARQAIRGDLRERQSQPQRDQLPAGSRLRGCGLRQGRHQCLGAHEPTSREGVVVAADQRRLDWDERHKGGDFEGEGPNPTLVAGVTGLVPGSALELASGSGTNAVWLAQQGWRTTAVDWSPVGLANGKAKADAAGVDGRLAGAGPLRVVASGSGVRPRRHRLSASAARRTRARLRPRRRRCGARSGDSDRRPRPPARRRRPGWARPRSPVHGQ